VLRYLETFYRYRFQLLAPVCLVLVAAAGVTALQPRTYTSTARIWVDRQTALGTSTSSDNNPYVDISVQESNTLAELIRTRSFCSQVGRRSHLSDSIASRPITPGLTSRILAKVGLAPATPAHLPSPAQVDDSVYTLVNANATAVPSGANIIDVSFTYSDPQLAANAAQALVDQFISEIQANGRAQAQAAADFYGSQAKQALADQTATSAKVYDYLAAHPELRPDNAVPDAKLIQLRADDTAARARYESIRSKLDQASINLAGYDAAGASGFRVLDPAQFPSSSTVNRKLLVQVLGGGLALGLLIFLVGLIALTLADTTLRRPEEVEPALGLRVVASAPRLRSPAA